MRIGVLGGTFNPPHLGHLLLADAAVDALALDRVLFIPAWQSPFKSASGAAAVEARCEMVALAVSDNPRFLLDTREAERGGVSYTVDTLRELEAQYSDAEFFLLLGADAFADVPLWKAPDEIVEHATIAVACRGGLMPDLDAHPYGGHTRLFPMPAVDISSSDIRRRVQQGASIRYLVPWAVRTFIEATGLYRGES